MGTLTTRRFILRTTRGRPGYIRYDDRPPACYCFTDRPEQAARFPSEAEAWAVVDRHYSRGTVEAVPEE